MELFVQAGRGKKEEEGKSEREGRKIEGRGREKRNGGKKRKEKKKNEEERKGREEKKAVSRNEKTRTVGPCNGLVVSPYFRENLRCVVWLFLCDS